LVTILISFLFQQVYWTRCKNISMSGLGVAVAALHQGAAARQVKLAGRSTTLRIALLQ